jgi:predicted acyl esterase
VPVEIEILPSSTLFRRGESLELTVQGGDLAVTPKDPLRRCTAASTSTTPTRAGKAPPASPHEARQRPRRRPGASIQGNCMQAATISDKQSLPARL